MPANVFGKRLVQRFGLFFKHATGDGDPSIAKLGKSLTADQRIWILHTGDDAGDSGGDQRVSARSSSTPVGAWFQIDVESCVARAFSCLLKSEDFCMLHSIEGVTPSADDCALGINNNRSHAWIG